MTRALLFLLLLPAPALAQWAPSPRAFAYDATFARCTADPTDVDVVDCDMLLREAYALNVAVVAAVETCGATPLNACSNAFEDKGLPAFAARIATEFDCARTEAAQFAPFNPLPANHCITMISDILRDEGVVPFQETDICDQPNSDCTALRDIHANLWYREIISVADTPLMQMRLDVSWDECFDRFSIQENALTGCHIENLSLIWADLAKAEN